MNKCELHFDTDMSMFIMVFAMIASEFIRIVAKNISKFVLIFAKFSDRIVRVETKWRQHETIFA